jgi:hypothetical protein
MKPTKQKLDLTKVRTRFEPPTIDDAVFAAQGLTNDPESQVEIAAQLLGRAESEVRPAVLRSRSTGVRVVARAGGRPAVVVERRHPRASAAR